MTMPYLRKLTYDQLREGYEAGLKSGRFTYKPGHGGYVICTVCGRHGGGGCAWMEDCILGHPYVCACGRVFSTKQGIAAHRRASREDAPGHTHKYIPTGVKK